MVNKEDKTITRKLNLDREGWGILFKDWQIPLIELLGGDTHDIVNPLRSREAMLYINNILLQEGKKKMSRASVIFFLQDLAEKGWLNVGTRTGKGGHHEVYHKVAPFGQFLDDLSFEITDKLQALKEEVKE